ncbi:MAG TPA: response regulator [Tepidisphaeraceae bacterium]|jgi:FixJ family two-component response regulator
MNQQRTVYLVDDDPAVLRSLASLLRANGYRPETFGSGLEFIEKYKPDASACLVLDLSMPGMSGLDVRQWLLDRSDPLPTMFLTGQSDIAEQVRTRLEQPFGILDKPVAASVLLKAIEEALRR